MIDTDTHWRDVACWDCNAKAIVFYRRDGDLFMDFRAPTIRMDAEQVPVSDQGQYANVTVAKPHPHGDWFLGMDVEFEIGGDAVSPIEVACNCGPRTIDLVDVINRCQGTHKSRVPLCG